MSSEAAGAACWVCSATESELWKARSIDRPLRPEDLKITDASYGTTLSLRRCACCGFLFAEGEEVDELVALYQRLDDSEYEATQDSRRLQMEKLVERARQARPQAQTLLDIGAGAGLLVEAARRQGLSAEGVEPSSSLVEAARRLHGVELHEGIFPHPELEGRRFDLITVVDVIEHVADPVALLAACGDALEEGGVVLLVTPDVKSLLARILGRRWWHFRLAHVGYFDRATLRRACEAAGLEVESWWRAGWYFRVSYLAERLAQYLPIGGLNRLLAGLPGLAWIYRQVVPLNLLDSWGLVVNTQEHSGSPSPPGRAGRGVRAPSEEPSPPTPLPGGEGSKSLPLDAGGKAP